MPMLAVTSMVWPSTTSGTSSARWIFSATMRGASMASPVARSTPNSSPPRRATMSESRSAARTRAPTSRSAWSPTVCPSVSLMALKRSMSSNTREIAPLLRRASRTACPTCL